MRSWKTPFAGRTALYLSALLILGALYTFASTATYADVPDSIGYQGILKTTGGSPVPDGSHNVTFSVYDVAAGPNPALWTETKSVTTVGGLFSTLLGSVTPLPASVFSGPSRYLGITVAADPEMTPRVVLVAVPYAYRVETVDGATGGSIVSKVSIGPGHTNTGADAFVAGSSNVATGPNSVVGGGVNDTASGDRATVAGGGGNAATGLGSTVSGGTGNRATNFQAAIAGGSNNDASGVASAVVGGQGNEASGRDATVAGGFRCYARGDYSFVGGGGGSISTNDSNSAAGNWSTVGGGFANRAAGDYSTVPGGNASVALGRFSFAAGRRALALGDGTFVWADSTNANFISSGANQFLIRASGGVGIGTDSPEAPLHVQAGSAGTVTAHSSSIGVFEGQGAAYVSILAGDLAERGVVFGQPSNAKDAAITYNNSLLRRGMQFRAGGDTVRMVIDSTGRVGIGVALPGNRIELPNIASGYGRGLANAWNVYSSRRWKDSIATIENALSLVERLRGVRYAWKTEHQRDIGLIAEEVGEVIPEVVQYEENGHDARSVDYSRLVAVLIEGMKEQNGKITVQQSLIEELRQRLDRLERRP